MSLGSILFVVSAPSGAGKTTLLRKVMKEVDNMSFSISHTTRPKRSNEQDGVDYHFVSDEKFTEMVNNNEFAEWAHVHGNRYGTSIEELEKPSREGVDLFIEIDTQGAKQLKGKLKDGVFVYVVPPSVDTLKKRLMERATEEEHIINGRLKKAHEELVEMDWFDYAVVNDKLEGAAQDFKAIIHAERCRMARRAAELKRQLSIA